MLRILSGHAFAMQLMSVDRNIGGNYVFTQRFQPADAAGLPDLGENHRGF